MVDMWVCSIVNMWRVGRRRWRRQWSRQIYTRRLVNHSKSDLFAQPDQDDGTSREATTSSRISLCQSHTHMRIVCVAQCQRNLKRAWDEDEGANCTTIRISSYIITFNVECGWGIEWWLCGCGSDAIMPMQELVQIRWEYVMRVVRLKWYGLALKYTKYKTEYLVCYSYLLAEEDCFVIRRKVKIILRWISKAKGQ